MALFSKKPKKEAKADKPAKKVAPRKATTSASRMSSVIVAPYFSEKALIGTEKGVYVFTVTKDATKKEISDAIQKLYKVTPRKVTLTHLPGKRKALRTRRGWGTRAARHKAYVHLAKGETITFA